MGARKSIVIGCAAVILMVGVATAVAIAKTSSRNDAYKAALPSPFVKEQDKSALREIERDQAQSAAADTSPAARPEARANDAVAVVAPRGTEKSAAQLDAEDRYIDRLAGQFEGRKAQPSQARPGQQTSAGGIPIPVGGIAVERAETPSATAGTTGDDTQSAVASQEQQQQQQVPYRDDYFPYYGAFPAVPTNAATNGGAVNQPVNAGNNGVVQAQPAVRGTAPNGAAVSAPAPGAVAAPNQVPQQNVPQPNLPQQNFPQQTVQQPQAPQNAPPQTAPVPQPVPFQPQPAPAAQRGY